MSFLNFKFGGLVARSTPAFPGLFGTGYQLPGRKLFPGGMESGFRVIQVRSIYCVLYFYHYSIGSTEDHQAL